MFSNGFFISLIITLFVSVTTFSQSNEALAPPESSEAGDIFYMCKRDKSIRWLRAYRLENGKCKALYSKEGYLQVISSATYFASCEGVLLSVKKNLEEGKFKCALQPKVSVIELDTE
jgi:hypothetical protein